MSSSSDSYNAWQFNNNIPPPLGPAQSISTSSSSAGTTTTTQSTSSSTNTTTATASTLSSTSSTSLLSCTGWCVRSNQLTSDNITYIITAACIIVLLLLCRHDKKVMTLLILWSINVYSFWFLSNYWLWNMIIVVDILTYRLLYPRMYRNQLYMISTIYLHSKQLTNI